METNSVVEVGRADAGTTRIVEPGLGSLQDGEVRLRVDRLALTANNITYAKLGDMLGYWDFFPSGDPAWGRVPAMGWADVIESAHPEVPTGGRYYGWFPMARFVDLAVSPTPDGVRDDGAHRQAHAGVYRRYVETTRDPMYPAVDPAVDPDPAHAATHLADAEDRHALLRGLFLTGFLADAFFADDHYLGAEAVVVLSASSKTAIGFAQRASERPVEVVGVTSVGNADFVRSLGWYDRVVTYAEVGTLPVVPTVSVDLSGDTATLAAVHRRLGDKLAYSMLIGGSHHDAPTVSIDAGPEPQFFFAPTEVGRRLREWGPQEYQRLSLEALATFVTGSEKWLAVDRTEGATTAEQTWHDLLAGSVPPTVGRVISLHG